MIEYRQATENDIPALLSIARQVIQNNYTSFLGADMVAKFIDSGMSNKEIHDGIHSCTIMVKDEHIIGFAITKEELLHLIMVDVDYQKSGYGSKLLRCMEDELFARFNCIRLQSFEKNEASVRFYLKNGWIIAGNDEAPDAGLNILLFHKCKK